VPKTRTGIMKELRRSLIFTIVMAALALACQSGTGLFSLFIGFAQYTIVYSDSGARSFTRTTGGFYSFLSQDSAANGRLTAVYQIGDSLQVTDFLPSGSQCPAPIVQSIGRDTLALDSATAIVLHKRLRGTVPDSPVSEFIIDSARAGELWGRFAISVRPVVPEFAGPTATLTGRFRIPEIEYLGRVRHCSGAA
jgi:hypothetical protein